MRQALQLIEHQLQEKSLKKGFLQFQILIKML